MMVNSKIKINSAEDIEGLRGTINPVQFRILKKLYIDIYAYDTHQQWNDDISYKEHEYKKFDIEVSEFGTVWVASVVGRIGDEETMASFSCRSRKLVSIGKRGGCKIHDVRGKRKYCIKKTGYNNCLLYNSM